MELIILSNASINVAELAIYIWKKAIIFKYNQVLEVY